ncbi:unnamed protein product, partial [Nippostrongylus brasiliensis]|uniref:Uncharacterized protein n=1 Tax=Nippostrongylus brasiliensis TaxID=27835 RepID=A0A0N4XG82_NIPBR
MEGDILQHDTDSDEPSRSRAQWRYWGAGMKPSEKVSVAQQNDFYLSPGQSKNEVVTIATPAPISQNNAKLLDAEGHTGNTTTPLDLRIPLPLASEAASATTDEEVTYEGSDEFPHSDARRRSGEVAIEPRENVSEKQVGDSDSLMEENAETTREATSLVSSPTISQNNAGLLDAEDHKVKSLSPVDLTTPSSLASAATTTMAGAKVSDEDKKSSTRVTQQEDSDLSTEESAENTTNATLLESSTRILPNNDTSLEAEDATPNTTTPDDLSTSSPFSAPDTSITTEDEDSDENSEEPHQSATPRRKGEVATVLSEKAYVTEQEDSELSTDESGDSVTQQEDSDLSADESAESKTDATLLASSTTILPKNDTSIEAEDVPLETTRPFDLSTSSPFS